MADIASSTLQLPVADGSTLQACAFRPSGPGPFPGIIVLQEAFGVNAHIKSVAVRFAREGFIAIAPELFHRSAPAGFTCGYTDFDSVRPHIQAITPAGLEADARTCWDWLRAQPSIRRDAIAAIGYCLGGRAAFVANSVLPLQAAVSYYGGGLVPDLIKRAPQLHAPSLFVWGGLDKHILPEQTAAVAVALRQAGKPFASITFSYADHGFFCDERAAYNASASREAWPLTLAFLREKLGLA